MNFLRWLFRRRPRLRRAEIRFLPYAEADKLIKANPGVWRIARPEEDGNRQYGWVYLERVESW